MLDYSDSPPPLHHSPATSEKVLPTSRESTPLTPVGFAPSLSRRPDKDRGKDGHLPWLKRPIDVGGPASTLFLDSSLLEPDFDDHSFPLFGASPPARSMAGAAAAAAAPINIATRHASTSPRGQQSSNLTSALQGNPDGGARQVPGPGADDRVDNPEGGKPVNTEDGASPWNNGAKPISMGGVSRDKTRRESVAQSLTGGMSWGGISVGSWIRDE
jgi:transcription factor SFP1